LFEKKYVLLNKKALLKDFHLKVFNFFLKNILSKS